MSRGLTLRQWLERSVVEIENARGGNIVSPTPRRRGRDLNPRRTFQHVRDFQSRSLGHSDTSPCCEAEKEGFEPSMEAFTPITP
jgi:hypothetical protein